MTASDVRQEVYGSDLSRDLLGLVKRGAWKPLARMVSIAAWTGGLLAFLFGGMWLTAPWPRTQMGWRNLITRRWARGLAWIVGMRMRVEGPRPQAPFFLVANHVGYVDIVLILAQLDGVFVAKRELNDWPVVGYLNRLVGTIFLDRQSRRDARRVITAIGDRIKAGDGVVVFPEGTSSDGADVYPMKPAMFQWAAETGYPVSHAAIFYQTPPGEADAREVVCWWGTMSFIPHVIELCQLRGFQATLRFGQTPLVGTDRTELAVQARQAIADNFVAHRSSELESP